MLLSIVVGAWAVKIVLPIRLWPVSKTATTRKTKTPKPTNIVENLVNFFIPTATTSPTPAPTSTNATTSTQAAVLPRRKSKSVPQISYGDAVVNYANNRIQFDQNCQAHPSHMAVANPVTLMLDNRSNVEQKITIGKAVYNVAGYNYVIATINAKTLPVNLFVNCNQQTNVAEIILE